jgi:hypothetical protein
MIAGLREFLAGKGGKVAGIIMFLASIAIVVYSVRHYLGPSEAEKLSDERMFVDSESLKAFPHTLEIGEVIPVKSPFSGNKTGYPAEACYWTKDGQIKNDPTWVLLNETIGKPGPTFCPDCGRLVIGHNPRPSPGDTPPPTEDEYKRAHGIE